MKNKFIALLNKVTALGKALLIILKELPYSKCSKCGKKGLSFSHEEHFTPGSPDVYCCKFCKKCYI